MTHAHTPPLCWLLLSAIGTMPGWGADLATSVVDGGQGRSSANGVTLVGSLGTIAGTMRATGVDGIGGTGPVIGPTDNPQLPDIQATVGSPLNRQLVAPWSVSGTWMAMGLPDGVMVNGRTITGVPTVAGTSAVTLRFTSAAGLFTDQQVRIVTAAAPVSPTGGPTVASAPILMVPDPDSGGSKAADATDLAMDLTTGSQFFYRLPVAIDTVVSFSGLPSWVTAQGTSGIISGTVGDPGTYIVTATATTANGRTITTTITLAVSAPVAGSHGVITITPRSSVLTLGETVSSPLVVVGDTTGIYYVADGLPPGVAIDRGSGLISGHPRISGSFVVRIRALRTAVLPTGLRPRSADVVVASTTLVLQILARPVYEGDQSAWTHFRDNVTGQGGCGLGGGIGLIGVGLAGLALRGRGKGRPS